MIAILIIVAAIASCIMLISDLAKPILAWSPKDWPEWLVVTLKFLAITVGSLIIIAGATCWLICMVAATTESKK